MLLRIIRRVEKDSREDPSEDAVVTKNQHAKLVRLHKLITKQQESYLLHETVLEESNNALGWRFAVDLLIVL